MNRLDKKVYKDKERKGRLMTVQEWTFLMVGISFAIYILIAIKSRARSTSDFYVAGKRR